MKEEEEGEAEAEEEEQEQEQEGEEEKEEEEEDKKNKKKKSRTRRRTIISTRKSRWLVLPWQNFSSPAQSPSHRHFRQEGGTVGIQALSFYNYTIDLL